MDKHGSFKETRCFYVVSADGSRADFSYIKCMENFIKGSYPDHAESFNRKFFRRRAERNNDGHPANNEPSNNNNNDRQPANSEPSNNENNDSQPANNDGQQS